MISELTGTSASAKAYQVVSLCPPRATRLIQQGLSLSVQSSEALAQAIM